MRKSVFARLSEPSTWAGMAALALALGISSESWETISQGLAGVFGVIAMLARESGSE